MTKTALIVVGRILEGEYERSKLYDPSFTTEFREASVPSGTKKCSKHELQRNGAAEQ